MSDNGSTIVAVNAAGNAGATAASATTVPAANNGEAYNGPLTVEELLGDARWVLRGDGDSGSVDNNPAYIKFVTDKVLDSGRIIRDVASALDRDAEAKTYWLNVLTERIRLKVVDDLCKVSVEFQAHNSYSFMPFANMAVIQGAYYRELSRVAPEVFETLVTGIGSYRGLVVARGVTGATIAGGVHMIPDVALTTSATLRSLALTDGPRFLEVMLRLLDIDPSYCVNRHRVPDDAEAFILRYVLGAWSVSPYDPRMMGDPHVNWLLDLGSAISSAWEDGIDGEPDATADDGDTGGTGREASAASLIGEFDYGRLTTDDVERMLTVKTADVRLLREIIRESTEHTNGADNWGRALLTPSYTSITVDNVLINQSNWRAFIMLMLPFVKAGGSSYTILPEIERSMVKTGFQKNTPVTLRKPPYRDNLNMTQDYLLDHYSWFIEHSGLPDNVIMDEYAEDYGYNG